MLLWDCSSPHQLISLYLFAELLNVLTSLQVKFCPKCNQGYANKQALDTHMRFHCGIAKSFSCPYCPYRCTSNQNLKTHAQQNHFNQKVQQPSNVCPKCNKYYHQRYNLLRHLKNECGIEPRFNCTFCAYICKRKDNLRYHMLRRHAQNIQTLPKDPLFIGMKNV